MGLDFYEGIAKKVKPMKEAIKDIPRHAPEHNWLHNLVWTMNSRHYNYQYQTYIKDEVIRKLGITIRLCEENFGSLEQTLKQQTEGKWHTRCDWDYRTKYEVDGSIKDLPQLQKWLNRNRGNSGVFMRIPDPKKPVTTGFELQILDTHGLAKPELIESTDEYDIVRDEAGRTVRFKKGHKPASAQLKNAVKSTIYDSRLNKRALSRNTLKSDGKLTPAKNR
jgi:hypothetical protein